MRIFLLLAFVATCSVNISAQKTNKKYLELKELYWGSKDKYKKAYDVPEKWKDESAVIIYQEVNYSYEGSSKSVDYVESFRLRVKLQDKAAVEEYSEFSVAEKFNVTRGFSRKGGKAIVGIKVVKPGGTEKEVDMAEAVEIKNDGAETFKKVAVPDLEVGDIVDYFYYIYEPFKTQTSYVFEPVISTISGRYSVMKQQTKFIVDKGFYIAFNSYNGAPKLKLIDSAKKKNIYQIVSEDVDRYEDERWFYEDRVLPMIKFQVVYARNNYSKENVNAFINDNGTVVTNVSRREVFLYYKDRLRFDYYFDFSDLNDHMAKSGISSKDEEAYVRELYDFMRYKHLTSKVEPYLFYESGIVPTLPEDANQLLNESGFIITMGQFLLEKSISFDLVVAPSRAIGNIDEVILVDELELYLKLRDTEEPMFFDEFGLNSCIGQAPYYTEETNAYYITSTSRGPFKIYDYEMPVSVPDDNKSVQVLELKFDDDIETVNINRTYSHYGHLKNGHQKNKLFLNDIVYEDYERFDKKPYIERAKIKKKERPAAQSRVKEFYEEKVEQQKDMFQEEAEEELEMEFKEYDSFEITNNGRNSSAEDNAFSYKEKFSLDGITKKAGKNIIVDIGKFIGGQVAIKEDELERKNDIFMIYPRSYINTIILDIPEGYSVEGLENLTKSVKNVTGSFESSASMENGKLVVKTKKIYNNNFEKKENWQNMVDFLDAAYQFTEEKILLKKG